MTPDTAALRALVDTYVTGWYLTAAEIRALCDAADEAERLREAASLRTLRMEINQGFGGPATIKVWRDNVLRFNGVDLSALMERDASRTAHAALVADLRALVGGDELVSQRAVNPDEYTRRTGDRVPSYLAFYQGAADLAAVIRALLDRHAPTLTTTED